KLGMSSFSGFSGQLDWEKVPYIEAKAGESIIYLEEVYPWLTSFENFPLKPEMLSGTGEIRDLFLKTTMLPGPLEVVKGHFNAVEDDIRQRLSFRNTHIKILDASLNVSGVLKDYIKGLEKTEVNISGDLGEKSTKWISKLVYLPPELTLRAPVSVSDAHLTWEKNRKTSFKGNLSVKNGPHLSLDLTETPEKVMIKDLLINDKESRASIALDFKKEEQFSFAFSGHLKRATLNRLFEKTKISYGSLEGDFQINVLIDHPGKSTAHGKLRGEHLVFPYIFKIPVKIDEISLKAEKRHIEIESATLMWKDRRIALSGDLDFSPNGFMIDMDLGTDGIEWSEIKNLADKNKEGKDVKQGEGLWDTPIKGALKIKSDYFKYDQFTWSPFNADITFSRDEIKINVTEANLCGISTPGVLKVNPQGLSLDFKPAAKNQELDFTIDCVTAGKNMATGQFDLEGIFKARGKPEELLKSLQGNFELVANEGRIYRDIILAKLFAYLNVTEAFFGKFPDFNKEGFGFHALKIKGRLQDGILKLEDAFLDGSSMDIAGKGHIDLIGKKMDLNLLVAPLKTVNRFVDKIPIVRGIFGGTLVSIPVKVKGDLEEPKVIPLSPAAVTEELLGIMKRTITLPFKVIEPVISKEKKEQNANQN
ncbi:MAG: AsmA-like C-terminal domain-containing protein, partial [Deltaproteobacteria bacterium]|nr:AsmA-like C-terminal domain-containing protein [Deltaproteobacteria bacterium]